MYCANNPYNLYYRKIWLAIGFLQILIIVLLTLLPNPPMVMENISHTDKIGHFFAYSLLMLWYCQIYPGNKQRLLLAILFILMGVALEYAQKLGGNRHYELADMLANTCGVIFGSITAYLGLNKFLHYLENFVRD